MLTTMLSNMTRIKCFLVDAQFLKIFTAENIPKWFTHPVNSLKHMWFRKFQIGDMDQLNGALCLLQKSPNLKTLGMPLEMESLEWMWDLLQIIWNPQTVWTVHCFGELSESVCGLRRGSGSA
uniref:FBD domain-containing protein n=1 Tax=Lactuca sativa TaxID=4236 RepID=A0A9R1WGQ6_LACSA|nr:hypothetical protein LSAT_V11C100032360 [Lactuca sativa]